MMKLTDKIIETNNWIEQEIGNLNEKLNWINTACGLSGSIFDECQS